MARGKTSSKASTGRAPSAHRSLPTVEKNAEKAKAIDTRFAEHYPTLSKRFDEMARAEADNEQVTKRMIKEGARDEKPEKARPARKLAPPGKVGSGEQAHPETKKKLRHDGNAPGQQQLKRIDKQIMTLPERRGLAAPKVEALKKSINEKKEVMIKAAETTVTDADVAAAKKSPSMMLGIYNKRTLAVSKIKEDPLFQKLVSQEAKINAYLRQPRVHDLEITDRDEKGRMLVNVHAAAEKVQFGKNEKFPTAENPFASQLKWVKSVTGIDKTQTTGYSIKGEFVHDKKEWHEPGLYLAMTLGGSNKHPHETHYLFTIDKNGKAQVITDGISLQHQDWATDLWPVIEREIGHSRVAATAGKPAARNTIE